MLARIPSLRLMPLPADLLDRKKTHFALWIPSPSAPPTLVIGQFQPGNPPTLANGQTFPLAPDPAFPDLFTIPAAACHLTPGQVYHYWFQAPATGILCTDPTAYSVDWRLRAPRMPLPFTADDRQPAAVVKFRDNALFPCDPGGEESDSTGDPNPATLPPNNRLVIYEMPTAWSRISQPDDLDIGVGTFRDILALVDSAAPGQNFDDLAVAQTGRQYLVDLGINAIELLPPADSFFKREWGYDTAHFLAPDTELGFPEGFSSSTANQDLANLIRAGHKQGIRFILDAVMAFARHEAYQYLDPETFYIANPAADLNDPDSHTSRGTGAGNLRNGFGSTLFRYARFITGYDPIGGVRAAVSPARQLMLAYITRWVRDFHIDGVRMDSVENVSNWDFVQQFKDRARELFHERCPIGGDERFLVVGEELNEPMELLTQHRLDGLWNDTFRALVRSLVIGEGSSSDFESNLRRAIDCRALGFTDGTQAINYLTSHDVEGGRRERLYNFLINTGLGGDIERRAKLAFVCLLTAVGVPMILAGEEFADEHDRFNRSGNVEQSGGKQVDPVNYARLQEPGAVGDMRRRILAYVRSLIALRTASAALSVNDTNFIHVDLTPGRRIAVWKRGTAAVDPVVVLANFSDFASNGPEYVVPNWPATPPGRHWREVTQQRDVPDAWIGREPLFPWEAKVYTLA